VGSKRWQKVSDLFEAALECAPAERSALLSRDAEGDEDLRGEVESLLASHDPDFMSTPVAVLAPDGRRALAAGQSFGQYRDVKPLGEGGMGEVYLALDTRLRRKVALKLLPPACTHDPERVRRFEREALAASALSHPNIVTIYEVGEVDGRHFIAAEYVEGETLRERLRRGPLGQAEALEIASQLASALEAAHAVGIVHRDIKPENVVVRPDGYIKLLDFGLAKLTDRARLADETGAALNTTRAGAVMGTANYMSPEQARGEEVDERADLWSLGVVLYECIAGRAPFGGETPSHVAVAIIENDAPPLPGDAEVAPEFRRIVAKALRKGREERYQTARELAGDLKHLKQGPAAATPGAEHRAGWSSRRRRWALPAAAALSAAVAVAALAYAFYPAASGETIDSVAVLPFANAGGDPDAEYLSDGISDGVINSLSELPNLERVVPFSSVLRYKGKQIDPQAVGRELNVGAVFTGRLAMRGGDVLVSTELVHVKDNKRLWGGQYSHKLADVSKLQSEIAQDISEKLRLKLTGEQQERLSRPDTENAEAYQLYLQGRYNLNKNTDEATLKSGEYFKRAIEKDQNFASAYVDLALYYSISANFGNMRPNEAWPQAEAAAVKALAIDDRLAEAHHQLGAVKMWYDWDWSGAEREFKRAVELEPELVRRGNLYVRLLEALGRFDEAVAEVNKADDITPGYRGPGLASVLFSARRYDEAIAEFRKRLETNPNNRGQWHLRIGMAYAYQGRYEEALAEVREARPAVTQPRQLAQIGYVYAAAGKRDEAVRVLEEVKALTGERHNLSTHIAGIYAGLGDKNEALAWLKRACDEHEQGVIDLKIDPRFDTLRSDPRFSDLLRRVKLAP
jgi:eukaryotic-like serine/threonine-protein kinase